MTDAVVVMTSLASEEEALPFVRMLLDQRLVACGTILPPARSIYRWEGKLADEREVVVLLKTRRDRVEDLQEAFERLHPYQTPELLVLPVHAGLVRYLAWINDETAGEPTV